MSSFGATPTSPDSQSARPAPPPAGTQTCDSSDTIFDLLYDQYLPFRLYADHMLGASTPELARQFALSEHWVAERIEAVRLCMEKQVWLNLLDRQPKA
jgi:hypothetical protein